MSTLIADKLPLKDHPELPLMFMNECDVVENDVLKGLTNKAFNEDYMSIKKQVYRYIKYLNELCTQIKKEILNT